MKPGWAMLLLAIVLAISVMVGCSSMLKPWL